ncbi:MAG: signal recognition particle receptor subunit alpha, partial [Oscillospiraceae bacterium]|nr:signal recognition particle receptor subunit alpha [Oscillospiraceae bacterium]
MGFFSRISEGLKKTRDSLKERFDDVFSGASVDEDLFDELEEALVLADTGAVTAAAICEELRKKVKKEGVSDPEKVREMMYEVVAEILRGGQELDLENKPAIIMMIGVNGAGKTTTIGKMAKNFVDEGKKVVVAAADTFRAAAIDQLQVWTDRCGAELIKHSEGSDPAAVVFDAIAAGKARK